VFAQEFGLFVLRIWH